jgi:hypothetical protein
MFPSPKIEADLSCLVGAALPQLISIEVEQQREEYGIKRKRYWEHIREQLKNKWGINK